MDSFCGTCRWHTFVNETCQQCWYPYCKSCLDHFMCDICTKRSDRYACDIICRQICLSGVEVCKFSNDTCYNCKDGFYSAKNVCKTCAYTGCQTCTNATLCETCKTGYWGKHCNLTCSSGCVNNTCNIEDGSCVCDDGYFGKACQHECAKTCPLSRVKENKTLCNSITGECSYCKTGFFGQFCDSTCNSNCSAGECKQMSGQCLACPLNETYGKACEHRCSNSCGQNKCYAEDGNCSLGCILNTTALSVNLNARLTVSPRRIGSCVMTMVRVWEVALMGTAETNV